MMTSGAVLEKLQEGDVVPPHLNRHPVFPSLYYREGMAPYAVTEADPSFPTCVANFGRYEYGLITITTAVPAYLGFSGSRSVRSFPFAVGLCSGLIAGVCYAYAYSFCTLSPCGIVLTHPADLARLTGIIPKHPN